MKVTVTHTGKRGLRGILTETGVKYLKPGETATVDIADTVFDKFKDGRRDLALAKGTKAPAVEPDPVEDEYDAFSDDDLRDYITQRDGKAPHANTGRQKLLDMARDG